MKDLDKETIERILFSATDPDTGMPLVYHLDNDVANRNHDRYMAGRRLMILLIKHTHLLMSHPIRPSKGVNDNGV